MHAAKIPSAGCRYRAKVMSANCMSGRFHGDPLMQMLTRCDGLADFMVVTGYGVRDRLVSRKQMAAACLCDVHA